jgi:O-antigen/teichoic acid export membrane protein
MSFLRNATGVLLTSVGESALGFATSIVLARWFSVEDRGLYAIAITFGTTLVVIARLGLPVSSIYRIRRIGSPPAEVASATLVLSALLTAAVMAIAWAFQPALSHLLLDDGPRALFVAALATVPSGILHKVLEGLARGLDRFTLANTYSLAANLLSMAAVVLVLAVGPGDVVTTLLAYAAARTAVALLFLVSVLRISGFALRARLDELLGSLSFAMKSYMQLLAGQLHERVDIILLASLLADTHAVAFYTIAVGMIDRLKLIPEAIASALFPSLSSLPHAEGARFTGYVARHTLLWVGLALAALGIVAPWILPLLYGEPYAASVAPFLILLPAMAFHSLYKVIARYFMAVDRQNVNIYTQGVALALNVGLNLWLIPSLGIVGAALSSLASYALESLLITAAFLWHSGLRAGAAFAPRRADFEIYRTRLRRVRARGAVGADGR